MTLSPRWGWNRRWKVSQRMRKQFITFTIAATCLSGTAYNTPAAPATAPATQPADPQSKAEKLFHEGTDALYQGNYEKAAGLLAQAVALDKSKSSYRMHLARAYRYAGKNREAEQL